MSTSLDVAPSETVAVAADVEDSRSAACWSVEEHGWKQVLPDLPDDVIALLATPVVVSAESFGAGRKPVPEQRAAAAPAPVQPDRAARPLLPAPPKRRRGKHRRTASVIAR